MLFFWCCELLVRSRLNGVSTSSKTVHVRCKTGRSNLTPDQEYGYLLQVYVHPRQGCLQFSNAHSLPQVRADLAASFQVVAVKHLEHRCRRGVSWALETCPGIK